MHLDYSARYRQWQTLPQVFFEKAREDGGQPLLWRKQARAWHSISRAEAAQRVSALARALIDLGVAPGDRVALIAENRPEWGIADLAIMSARAIAVPAYTTNTVDDHAHILKDSGAKLAIVSTAKLAERLLPAAERIGVKQVISIEPAAAHPGVTLHGWDEMLARGQALPDRMMEDVGQARRTDTACLIYTSGTGGVPKGVMLSHGAILHNCHAAFDLLDGSGEFEPDAEVFLSFLPLSHSYEHMAGLHFPISLGGQIYYAESVDKLTDNMGETHPTIMTAVPRLYEVMHQRITAGITRQGGLTEKLFRAAVATGLRRIGGKATLVDRILDPMLDRLVRAKVRDRFGGRLKFFVSGGAPLNPEIGEFFLALGVRLLQGYGQTETAPLVSCNPPQRIRIATVGPVVKDTEVKLAEDGEILVRGELMMQGYWNNPLATSEVLRGGWVHTGDIGEFDPDGYLRITDRKKDIIVVSGGDNVSPSRIEGMLVAEPEIEQAMVHGDKRPHLVGLLVPRTPFVEQWARSAGKTTNLAALADDDSFARALQAAVDRVNARLSPIERLRKFAIAEAPFSIENGMMTPKMSIRRHKIRERYGKLIDSLYG
ncbi:MAG: long-chain fatty acid--CoA ligase [Alphaproteobacteria bacterium]|nr:long-chain fatty acid--CoA ligase [Alphaproteobacteria bacterium]